VEITSVILYTRLLLFTALELSRIGNGLCAGRTRRSLQGATVTTGHHGSPGTIVATPINRETSAPTSLPRGSFQCSRGRWLKRGDIVEEVDRKRVRNMRANKNMAPSSILFTLMSWNLVIQN
jgi:hypothetical protein